MVNKTKPPKVSDKKLLVIPYVVAGLFSVMAVTQLTNFEAFVESLNSCTSSGVEQSTTVAILIITLEIFAIPALIRLWLSRLARLISSLFMFLAPFVWVVLLLLAASRNQAVDNIGIFGEYVSVPLNIVTIFCLLLLLAMSSYSFIILGLKKECYIPKA